MTEVQLTELWECGSCGERSEEGEVPIYECSRCSYRGTEEDAPDRRCPTCNIFMARVGTGCPSCYEEGTLELKQVDLDAEKRETEERRERLAKQRETDPTYLAHRREQEERTERWKGEDGLAEPFRGLPLDRPSSWGTTVGDYLERMFVEGSMSATLDETDWRAISKHVSRLETAARSGRDALQNLRHPNREPRTGAEAREALTQSAGAAGVAVDRIDHLLGECGEFCPFCPDREEESSDRDDT